MSSITTDQLKHLGKLACLSGLENDSKILNSLQDIIPLLETLNKAAVLQDNNTVNTSENCLLAEHSRQDIIKNCNGDKVLAKICTSFNPQTKRITVPIVVEK